MLMLTGSELKLRSASHTQSWLMGVKDPSTVGDKTGAPPGRSPQGSPRGKPVGTSKKTPRTTAQGTPRGHPVGHPGGSGGGPQKTLQLLVGLGENALQA